MLKATCVYLPGYHQLSKLVNILAWYSRHSRQPITWGVQPGKLAFQQKHRLNKSICLPLMLPLHSFVEKMPGRLITHRACSLKFTHFLSSNMLGFWGWSPNSDIFCSKAEKHEVPAALRLCVERTWYEYNP